MSATDELRRLLDERGVEHSDEYVKSSIPYCDGYEWTYWGNDSFGYVEPIRPKPNTLGSHPELTIDNCTPEQAIAATLGNDGVERSNNGVADALQAKVKAQSDHINKLRGEYKALDEQMERRCAEYRATIRKLKAEFDAATLGNDGLAERGTCHYEPDQTGFTWWDENDVEHYEEYSANDDCWSASCDKCGYEMMVGDEGWFDGWDEITEWTEEDGSEHKGYVLKPRFKFCPNCGREVVDE